MSKTDSAHTTHNTDGDGTSKTKGTANIDQSVSPPSGMENSIQTISEKDKEKR